MEVNRVSSFKAVWLLELSDHGYVNDNCKPLILSYYQQRSWIKMRSRKQNKFLDSIACMACMYCAVTAFACQKCVCRLGYRALDPSILWLNFKQNILQADRRWRHGFSGSHSVSAKPVPVVGSGSNRKGEHFGWSLFLMSSLYNKRRLCNIHARQHTL